MPLHVLRRNRRAPGTSQSADQGGLVELKLRIDRSWTVPSFIQVHGVLRALKVRELSARDTRDRDLLVDYTDRQRSELTSANW